MVGIALAMMLASDWPITGGHPLLLASGEHRFTPTYVDAAKKCGIAFTVRPWKDGDIVPPPPGADTSKWETVLADKPVPGPIKVCFTKAATATPKVAPAEDAIAQWYAAGRCIVRWDHAVAAKVLSTRPASLASVKAVLTSDDHRCMLQLGSNANVPAGQDIARGVVAEALLLNDFSAIGVKKGSRLAVPFQPLAVPASPQPGEAYAIAQLQVAECVVEAQPTDVFALFKTQPGGDDESNAVRRIAPSIQACVPIGVTMTIRPQIMRTYLAEAAYRVSVRMVAAAAAPKGK